MLFTFYLEGRGAPIRSAMPPPAQKSTIGKRTNGREPDSRGQHEIFTYFRENFTIFFDPFLRLFVFFFEVSTLFAFLGVFVILISEGIPGTSAG